MNESMAENLINIIVAYRSPLFLLCEVLVMVVLVILINALINLIFRRLQQRPALSKLGHRLRTVKTNLRVVLFGVWGLALVALVAVHGLRLFQGEDLYVSARTWLENLPADIWSRLVTSLGLMLALVIGAMVFTRIVSRLLHRAMLRAKAFEQIRANDESIEVFFTSLDNIQRIAIWLLVAIVAVTLFELAEVTRVYLIKALNIYLIFSVGMLIVKGIAALIDSLDGLSRRYSRPDNFLRYYDQLRGLIPLLRRSIEYIIYVTMATLVLTQLEGIASLAAYGPRIVQVIGIFFLSRVIIEVFNLLIDARMGPTDDMTEAEEQQRLTFVPLVKSIGMYAVYALAFVMMLNALHIDPTPILASAGLLGLVVGLGAQPLINDFISGFFILFENLYMVNDFIETGNARGTVEAIDIRTTRIRGGDGEQHILRNGQIGEIINYSKNYAMAVVLVGVAYESDLDDVYRVLRETAEALQGERDDILVPVELVGLDAFGESELTVRLVSRVKPGRHLIIAREMRTRIKQAFDREGIEIPYARRVVIFSNPDDDNAGAPAPA